MELKINTEIRNYTESIFFGLSVRQFIFSAAACGIAAFIYLSLNQKLGTEITSWICIFVSLPFAALGFITYQGMTFEKIVIVAIYSFFLNNTKLISKPINFYYDMTKHIIEKDIKEAKKRDKKLYKALKSEQRKV
ncbi:MAG: PrgI family protein [Erysipelotrichaceae bacterium]|nr:PrgI family protein [Erysipelotrichaceae bacterium]